MAARALSFPGRVIAAMIAVGLTAAAPALASPSAGPLSLASVTDPFAGCTFGADSGGINFPNAEVEPFVAVNPANTSNVIGVFQQDRWSDGGAHGLLTAYSNSGGASWTNTFPAFSQCAGGDPTYNRSSDPWVSIGPDGRAYQVSLSFAADNSVNAILASTSTDGGANWSGPATITRDAQLPSGGFDDKESVTADPAIAGTAYAVWDQSNFPSDRASIGGLSHSFAFRGTPMFSKTTDGGATWSAPQPMSSQNIASIGNQIVVEPDGTLIDGFLYSKGSGFNQPNQTLEGIMRSTDGGAHWSPPIQVTDNVTVNDIDPNNGVPMRTGADVGGGLPSIAADPASGKLYLVFEDSRFSGTHNDIAMSTSSNEGKTWTPVVKVNQTPKSVLAFTPAVNVLPDGTVGVSYYDIRNDTGSSCCLLTDDFIAVSHDGGSTWSEARITPASFDDTLAPISRGYFLGDYQGLANDGKHFISFFAQTESSGPPTSPPTDVFESTITP